MVWQDLALMILNIIVGYALIPQVYHGFKTKRGNVTFQTSIVMATAVFGFAFVFATMDLYLSAGISAFNGIMWTILLIQKLVYK
ncbi:hypothetical protein KAS08_04685 [Candidatus Pacearchaeota archaeon]|nr:hypothetical protein [Candidatus Pacearchaeota archaeon]